MTQQIPQPAFGEAVLKDRTRRGMTRKDYADLAGVTAAKVEGAEKGRRVKSDTFGALMILLQEKPDTTGMALPPDPDKVEPVDAEYQDRKRQIVERVEQVMQRCGGTAPPIGWPAGYYRPDTAPPDQWPNILRWADEVDEWLSRNGVGGPAPVPAGVSSDGTYGAANPDDPEPDGPHTYTPGTEGRPEDVYCRICGKHGSPFHANEGQPAPLNYVEQKLAESLTEVGAQSSDPEVAAAMAQAEKSAAERDAATPWRLENAPAPLEFVEGGTATTPTEAGAEIPEAVSAAPVDPAPAPPLPWSDPQSDPIGDVLRAAERGKNAPYPPQDPIADIKAWADAYKERAAQGLPDDQGTTVQPHPHGWMMEPAAVRPPEPEDGFELVDGVRYVTNSEMKTFKDCQRAWWLEHYRKLGLKREKRTGARALGTRLHAALSGSYQPEGRARDPFAILQTTFDEDRQLIIESSEPEAVDETLKELGKERDLAFAMLEGYFQWLAETGADAGLHVVGSEQRVSTSAKIPERPDVHFLTKQDVRLVRETDNARLFLDHKTTQSFSKLFAFIQEDEQMLLYHLVEYLDLLAQGADAEQTRTAGVIYNGIRKVKRTATAKPPFYRRELIWHNTEQLRSFWLRAKGTVRDILAAEARLDAGEDPRSAVPARPTSDCSWKCDYFGVCPMFDDGSRAEDMLSIVYVPSNPLDRYLDAKSTESGE